MSDKSPKRVRVERGLYRKGTVYYACATAPGGRAVWKSLGAVGVMQARRLRDEFVAEVRRGQHSRLDRDGRRATFAQVADVWLAAQQRLVEVGEMAPRTVELYELSLRRHLKPYFGTRAVRTITPDDLVTWHADQRQQGHSAWSIKGRWTALRLVLGYAFRHGLIDGNPCDALTARERPKPGPSRARFLTEDEMRRLLDAASGRDRVLLAVLLFAGLRISEALGLTWQDVDFQTGHLRVRYQLGRDGTRVRLKTTGANRDVVLMDALVFLLRRHRNSGAYTGPSDFVFATQSGNPVEARNHGRALARAVTRAKLTGVTPHVLRHTYASLLIAQGRDPVFVADQLGHADPAITLRVYAHLFRAAKQGEEARAALDASYGSFLRPDSQA